MPELQCPSCNATLRIGSEHAGRQVRCPSCSSVFTMAPSKNEQLGAEPAAGGWQLRTEDGRVFGPVDRSGLDDWYSQGRISANCHLQGPGSNQWQPATAIYTGLANPQPAQGTANPYYAAQSAMGAAVEPHRGGMILTLGILGFLMCAPLSLVAWLMGRNDLKKIRAGQMDRSGEGLTQAGMILGLIQCILVATVIAIYIVILFFVLVIGGIGAMQ